MNPNDTDIESAESGVLCQAPQPKVLVQPRGRYSRFVRRSLARILEHEIARLLLRFRAGTTAGESPEEQRASFEASLSALFVVYAGYGCDQFASAGFAKMMRDTPLLALIAEIDVYD